MLGKSARILAVLVVAGAIAAPVSAHINSKRQLDTTLVELSGRVVKLHTDEPRKEDGSVIVLETKNVNKYGKPQPGVNTFWSISADSEALKAAGITRVQLADGSPITISGYRVADDRCENFSESDRCYFAGRLLTLESGCVAFIGRSPFAFGRPATAWGKNIPDDGLDKVERSKC